jgi:polyphosphate:AMP phosphotransferase
MFEVAELGQKVSKEEYKAAEGPLRDALLAVQREMAGVDFPVLVVIAGADAAGKGDTVNTLMEWFDPRGIRVHVLADPTDEERERPPLWRWWRRLARRSRMAVYLGSWYTDPIVDRVYRQMRRRELDCALAEICSFERMLADDGALLVKFWLHISRREQKKRLEKLESDPLTAWRVTAVDWKNFRQYARFRRVCEHALRETGTGHAPWHIVESPDPHHRNLTVARTLCDSLKERLALSRSRSPAPRSVVAPFPAAQKSILSSLDYARAIPEKKYRALLLKWQGRLNELARDAAAQQLSVVVVFEGADAAGKGGNIRRLTAAMDAKHYEVIPIAAPTEEERAHPYMWRFWNHLPRAGRITIFDRSWYGRVLVEPAEGFCSATEWARAYEEINDFEAQLASHGTLVVKFWLAITKDEQLRRFQEREQVSYKRFKIGPDDYRNREKWEVYETLIHEMVERTSTRAAPWVLVEANDKSYARIKTLRTLAGRIQDAL